MPRGEYDVIVVGAGVEGSSAAYSLAKKGSKTLLIEQFPLPHTRGSSHGYSRITRRFYDHGQADLYTQMVIDSESMIQQLEKETSTNLFGFSGCLNVSKDQTTLQRSAEFLQRHNLQYQQLTANQINGKYPIMSMPENTRGIMDASGGVLYADKILTSYWNQIKHFGGTICDAEKLVEIIPGHVVTIVTNKSRYTCNSVILTLGPWSKPFMQTLGIHLPLKVVRINVMYWKLKDKLKSIQDVLPAFRHLSAVDGQNVYGMPSKEYPGLYKLCLHDGPEVDPENRDAIQVSWVIEKMCVYVAKHFSGLEPKPAIIETCLYTNSPDKDVIIDCLPSHENIVFAAGFSGHGFKLAPAVGKILASLATRTSCEYNISPLQLHRFKSQL